MRLSASASISFSVSAVGRGGWHGGAIVRAGRRQGSRHGRDAERRRHDRAPLTVRQAMERYVEFKHHKGQPVQDTISRSTVHILPSLGDLVVAELTAEQLRRWLSTMAAAPAQSRPRGGKPRFRAAPATAEEARARRATANRVLTVLKAALNHAFDEGHVGNRDAWAAGSNRSSGSRRRGFVICRSPRPSA
jgi:hypothetical protein